MYLQLVVLKVKAELHFVDFIFSINECITYD